MSIASRLIMSTAVSFLVGCAPISGSWVTHQLNSSRDRPTFSFQDCMPYVHDIRNRGDIPPALTFVRNISQSIFSCEYFRSRPIRRYGNFGPKLKVNKQTVYAGWGYAITDRPRGLIELLNISNFAEHYRGSGNVTIKVIEEPLYVNKNNKVLKAYFVNVSGRYVSAQTVAVLGIFDFSNKNRDYRLFLWAQNYRLARHGVSKLFGTLMEIVPTLSTGIAELYR